MASVAPKHTPGPWKHEPSTQARYSWLVLTADFDEDANRGTVLCRTSDCIAEADARLIAAAPDLLAACRRVLRAIEWGETADRMDDSEQADTLRAAINKAGGVA